MKMHIEVLLIDELFFAKYLTILNSLYYRERTKKLYWNYVGFFEFNKDEENPTSLFGVPSIYNINN
jgi:hypothetical protein